MQAWASLDQHLGRPEMFTEFSAAVSLHCIQEHPYFPRAANDDNQAVVARLEHIAASVPLLLEQLQPAISAVRSGTITQVPSEVFYYLLGALHALAPDEDLFFELFDVLDCLRPAQGVDSLLSMAGVAATKTKL